MAKSNKKPRTLKTGLAKRKGFQFKWWMGVVIAVIIAVVGLVVLRFSNAAEDPKTQSNAVYQKIVADKQKAASRGDKEASAQVASLLPESFVPPPKPANFGNTSETPTLSKTSDTGQANSWLPTLTTRQKILLWAKDSVGKNTHDFGFPCYPNGYCEPWCSDFVSWVMLKSGVAFWWGIDGWRVPYSGNIAAGINYFGNLHPPSSYVPEAGDVVFFYWQNPNAPGSPYDHVGIVTGVNGYKGVITTIEGNAGSAANSQTVVEQHTWPMNSPYILAYGRWPN